MRKFSWKPQLVKSLKIAAAALVSVALAGELSLSYSATAGIITVLSVRDTKRETLKSAGSRGLAFLCALLLSGACFGILGFNLWAFGVYLLLFSMLCLCAGWGEAIAMDSVLVTHFLTEKSMAPGMLINEALLFAVGAGMGILVNLHLHGKSSEFERLAGEADSQMKGILHRMSMWLPREDKSGYGDGCFERLERALGEARDCAARNYNNSLFSGSHGELEYIEMREKQSLVLRQIYDNIVRISYLPDQAGQVAELLGQIESDFHRDNTVAGLQERLEELLAAMKEQPLPGSREEFEARAILFYILMQLRQFLELKREFVLGNAD